MLIGLMLAAVAAVAFGTGTFVQHLSAREVENPGERRPSSRGLVRLLASLVRRPQWLLGQALAGGGTATQFAALAFAPVAVVEPIVAAGLLVALTLEVVHLRRPPTLRLATGLALCVAGLILFLLFSRAGGPTRALGAGSSGLLLAGALVLALISRHAPSGRSGSVASGAAAGATLGVAVVAVAVAIRGLEADGVLGLFASWRPYIALATGFLATAATQQAYTRGRLAWSLPALTVADPLVATLLSVLLLGEHLVPAGAPVWASGAGMAVVGVVLTATTRGARGLAAPGSALPGPSHSGQPSPAHGVAAGGPRPNSVRAAVRSAARFRSPE